MTKEEICELFAIACLGVAMCVSSFTLGAGICAGILADTRAENAQAAAMVMCGSVMLWLAACLAYAFENR